MEQIRISLGSVNQTGNQLSSGLGIGLVLRGRVTLKVPGGSTVLTENHMVVVNRNELFSMESSGPNVLLWVEIGRKWLETMCPETANSRYACCSAADDATPEILYDNLRKDITRLAVLYFRQESGDRLLLQSQLFKILYTLQSGFCTVENQIAPGNVGVKLQEILLSLHKNYREPLTLNDTARVFFFSPSHLSRMFRRELGVTFLEYLTALRLESARQELLETDLSITRIALGNGFSSVRAMNQYFRKQFGCTPGQYRSQAKNRSGKGNLFWLEARPDSSLETLARFLDAYENQEGTGIRPRVVRLPAAGHEEHRPVCILDVGNFSMSFLGHTQQQIRCARREIGFSFIRLSGLFGEQKAAGLEGQMDRLLCLEQYIEMGMTPFLVVDTEHDGERLETDLPVLLSRFGHKELGTWKFECLISSGGALSNIGKLVKYIRSLTPHSELGFHLDPEAPPGWAENAEGKKLLSQISDFITVSTDPNQEAAPEDAAGYEIFQRQYCRRQVEKAVSWMRQQSIDPPVYLVDWNTLTGRTIVEAGEFHRTALIIDLLMDMRKNLAGVSAGLNLRRAPEKEPELPSYSLSLFLYQDIRRPLFFAMRAMDGLGTEILWKEPGVIVTKKGEDQYMLLLWNPCYIDPFQSLENLRKDDYQKTEKLVLEGLRPGKYRIKRFLLDKDNGSTYRSWLKMDLFTYVDQEVLEYMRHTNHPSVFLEERSVDEKLEIVQPLALNAVSLWSVKRSESPGEPLEKASK